MKSPKEDQELMRSLQNYLKTNNLYLEPHALFEWGIDCVGVFVNGNVVLNIGLPPVSNYLIEETEYTGRYMRQREQPAV
ncbi:MAG: hypothetical protein FWH20_00700 [Oscillospiraceae bacterium]|nr:hypothetical protein [Oscillospiraceae bacterium]